MNNIDIQYQKLCKEILDYGFEKNTRNGKVLSIFGSTIRHNMGDGFPLLTTKKMAWKQIVTELLWFLRGDTNIKFLLDNDCHIWDGDAYKNFKSRFSQMPGIQSSLPTKEEFIDKIKNQDGYAELWGELGPIYGKQWRKWNCLDEGFTTLKEGEEIEIDSRHINISHQTDQIANLIRDLKTNPDSRRLMVSAWNVGELDQMVLPPCHYGFQVYTRELSLEERLNLFKVDSIDRIDSYDKWLDDNGYPKRAISLMWNQRSVDVPLGLPFNIASYGLLLEMLAKQVNMVPDELIGNLGDCHIYENQIEGIKEQLTRDPFDLPTLNINDEFWNHEYQTIDGYIKSMEIGDFQVENYQSHPAIKMPLSN